MTLREGQTVLAVGGGGAAGHVMDWSRRFLAAAADRGLKVIVADLPAELAPLRHQDGALSGPSAPRLVEVDWRDVDAVSRLTRRIAAEADLGAVVGLREFSLLPAATAAEAHALPWNPVAAIALTRDKWCCRQRLVALGYEQPGSIVVERGRDVHHSAAALGYPIVVKPRSAYGSQGVRIIRSAAELDEAATAASGFGRGLLVEQLVEGAEFSVEGGFVDEQPVILAIHRKRTSAEHCVETGHRTADDFDPVARAQLQTSLERILPALGLRHSLFHVEFWLTAAGIVFGEFHSRVGGDWIHLMTHIWSRIDMFGHLLDDLMGRCTAVGSAFDRTGPAVAASVLRCEPGSVTRVDGVTDIIGDPSFLALDLAVGPGSVVRAAHESGQRAGLVLATAATEPDSTPGVGVGSPGVAALAAADRLAAAVRIRVQAPEMAV